MDTIKNYKYKFIKNFLNKEEIDIGSNYLKYLHKLNLNLFDMKQSNNCDSNFYYDPLTETLMMRKLKTVEEISGLKLFPTYSFTRVYTFNSNLQKHIDRESCEVSITVMWDSDGTKWPIFMDGTPIEMQPGDAVIYLGRELPHWRETFEGDFHIQSFLHYVDQNGPFKKFKYDKRDDKRNPEV